MTTAQIRQEILPLARPWWQRIPGWLQPAVNGAIAIGGIVAFRVLFMSASVTMKLGIIGIAILGGAAPGLVLLVGLIAGPGLLGAYVWRRNNRATS